MKTVERWKQHNGEGRWQVWVCCGLLASLLWLRWHWHCFSMLQLTKISTWAIEVLLFVPLVAFRWYKFVIAWYRGKVGQHYLPPSLEMWESNSCLTTTESVPRTLPTVLTLRLLPLCCLVDDRVLCGPVDASVALKAGSVSVGSLDVYLAVFLYVYNM